MRNTSGLRLAVGVLLAVVLHGLLVVGLLLKPEEAMPQEIIFDVVLAPPWPPRPPHTDTPRASSSRAVESLRSQTQQAAVTPERQAPDRGAWQVQGAGTPQNEAVRRSLRAGVGCRSSDFLGLTKAEREACNDKLAAGAKDGPVYAVISPKLKKEFDGVFECPKGDVWCEYRVGKAPYPGLLALGRKKRSDWD